MAKIKLKAPRRAYVIDYTDADGKRRRQSFTNKRQAILALSTAKADALRKRAARIEAAGREAAGAA
jgi:hypothetical protein